MLIVEISAKIRRLHFMDGKGIKRICHDLRLSKKVVRKVYLPGPSSCLREVGLKAPRRVSSLVGMAGQGSVLACRRGG